MSPVFTLLQDRVNRRDSWRLIARLLKFTTKRVSRLLTKAVTKAVWPTRNRKPKNRTSPTISQGIDRSCDAPGCAIGVDL